MSATQANPAKRFCPAPSASLSIRETCLQLTKVPVVSLPTPIQTHVSSTISTIFDSYCTLEARRLTVTKLQHTDYTAKSCRFAFQLTATNAVSGLAEFKKLQNDAATLIATAQKGLQACVLTTAKLEVQSASDKHAANVFDLVGFLCKALLVNDEGYTSTDELVFKLCRWVVAKSDLNKIITDDTFQRSGGLVDALRPYTTCANGTHFLDCPDTNPLITRTDALPSLPGTIVSLLKDLCVKPCIKYKACLAQQRTNLLLTEIVQASKLEASSTAIAMEIDDELTIPPQQMSAYITDQIKKQLKQNPLKGSGGAKQTRASLKKKKENDRKAAAGRKAAAAARDSNNAPARKKKSRPKQKKTS